MLTGNARKENNVSHILMKGGHDCSYVTKLQKGKIENGKREKKEEKKNVGNEMKAGRTEEKSE